MEPNFALLLSEDRIELLHLSAGVWHSVGHANPSSDTLAEELAFLRSTATALDPSGLRCKLVIPNDQIRYLSIPTPELEGEEKRAAARAALVDATPYNVSDLVFDTYDIEDNTQIAAVAKETLEEAESFAISHRMHPVSFAAAPDSNIFAVEPYFGPAKSVETATAPVQAPPEPEPTPDDDTIADVEPDVPDNAFWEDDLPVPEPEFVSQRRVPTFRTSHSVVPLADEQEPTPINAGFNEPAPAFEPKPKSQPKKASPPRTKSKISALVPKKPVSEADRLTVFGARSEANAASGRSGAAGMLVLVCVALFAGLIAFVSSATGTNLVNFVARMTSPTPVAQFTSPQQPESPANAVDNTAPQTAVTLASLNDPLNEADATVLDARKSPEAIEEPQPEAEPELSDIRASYAVTGIWSLAPDVPAPPPQISLEDFYVPSIDPAGTSFDAVALPPSDAESSDRSLLALASPAPAGTRFELDEDGMVIPSENGSMNPDGIMIFAGAPPLRQPSNLLKTEDPGVDLAERLQLAAFRPRVRPEDLRESSERAAFSGLTRSELGQFRPKLRPQSEQENALAAASLVPIQDGGEQSLVEQENNDGFDTATARAVAASLRPDARPSDFSKTVAKAKNVPKPTVTASATSIAPRIVTPKFPSSTSASREATVKNAINLRKVNLIGVYGKPSSRSALIRLSNGRYRKVQVGDRIDGGKVSAIGDSELRYQKSGRAIVLKMPRG